LHQAYVAIYKISTAHIDSKPVSIGTILLQMAVVVFLKMDRDSEAIVRYVIPAIASEYPPYISICTREAGSRLLLTS